MKKVFILLAVLSLALVSCVIDFAYPMYVINRTNDTILIGFGRYNNIDSTKRFMNSAPWDTLTSKDDTLSFNRVLTKHVTPNGDTLTFYWEETRINGGGKLSIGKHDLVPPDSSAGYHEPHHLFIDRPNQTGCFYVIKLETARKHTWEEICRDTLYDTIVITQDMLKQGNHFDYWGNDSVSVNQDAYK